MNNLQSPMILLAFFVTIIGVTLTLSMKKDNTPIGPISTTKFIDFAGSNKVAQVFVAKRIREGITYSQYDSVKEEIKKIKAQERVKLFLEAHQ